MSSQHGERKEKSPEENIFISGWGLTAEPIEESRKGQDIVTPGSTGMRRARNEGGGGDRSR